MSKEYYRYVIFEDDRYIQEHYTKRDAVGHIAWLLQDTHGYTKLSVERLEITKQEYQEATNFGKY